uniref:Uncharacterized protein n=1 Tax=Vespula pensylvanica TaxID=30213 RepID=A0A834U7U1_VESPE|nr:hypothetical protein H0235_010557 [Vespula pensylvanica]
MEVKEEEEEVEKEEEEEKEVQEEEEEECPRRTAHWKKEFFNEIKPNDLTPFGSFEKSFGSRAALTMIRPQHDGGGVTEQQGFTEATMLTEARARWQDTWDS